MQDLTPLGFPGDLIRATHLSLPLYLHTPLCWEDAVHAHTPPCEIRHLCIHCVSNEKECMYGSTQTPASKKRDVYTHRVYLAGRGVSVYQMGYAALPVLGGCFAVGP